jgi:hypothetical protein
MKTRILLVTLSLALWLGGCANLSKVDKGEAIVKDNLVVTVDSAWNQFSNVMGSKAVNWTKEGLFVDRLQFYVGVKDGDEIEGKLPGASEQRPLVFKASMQPHEIVQVFQNVLTRDGSTFTLGKLEPSSFLGAQGFRVDYGLIRKGDDVQMKGFAYGVVRDGKLYLMHFTAPRLAFFSRYAAVVEQMARTARLKS